MTHDFTHDAAGRPGGVSPQAPHWLRLTPRWGHPDREESPAGTTWTTVGRTASAGLPATVRIGLFVASPGDLTVAGSGALGSGTTARLVEATAVFDRVDLRGRTTGGGWLRDDIGAVAGDGPGRLHHPGPAQEDGGTVTGNGDIAPAGIGGGPAVELTLIRRPRRWARARAARVRARSVEGMAARSRRGAPTPDLAAVSTPALLGRALSLGLFSVSARARRGGIELGWAGAQPPTTVPRATDIELQGRLPPGERVSGMVAEAGTWGLPARR